jgi:hypothetical protein
MRSSNEKKYLVGRKKEGEATMTTIVENTFTSDESEPSIRIRSFAAADGTIWSSAADLALACGYSSVARALAAAACKGSTETRKEAGEVYVSPATAMQIASRKGYRRFLQWLIPTLEQRVPAMPASSARAVDVQASPEPREPPEAAVLQAPADDAVGRVLAGTDAVMERIMDAVTKQIELQTMATSYRAIRDSGLPYEMQKDLQRKLADKIVELSHGDRADEYVSAGQILRERGLPAYSVDRLESEFGKDLMLVARREQIPLPPMNLHNHRDIMEGCCRVWHREQHAELINDVLESFCQRPLWTEHVSARAQTRVRADLLGREGRGRRRR